MKRKGLLILVFVLLIAIVKALGLCMTYHVGDIEVENSTDSLYNHFQTDDTSAVFSYDSEIYFYHYDYLRVIRNGWLGKVEGFERAKKKLGESIRIDEYADGYLYFSIWDTADGSNMRRLYSYDLSTSEYKRLLEDFDYLFVGEDTVTVYAVGKDKNGGTSCINKSEIIGEAAYKAPAVTYKGEQYALEGIPGQLICLADQKPVKGGNGITENAIFPCENGILLFDFNADTDDILQLYKPETEETATLFSIKDRGLSYSAVNRYGEYIYVSVKRREYSSFVGYASIKGDTLSGTYRISVETQAVDKISEKYFTGFYIFNSVGIFCTTMQDRLYLMDFDGNIIKEIIE